MAPRNEVIFLPFWRVFRVLDHVPTDFEVNNESAGAQWASCPEEGGKCIQPSCRECPRHTQRVAASLSIRTSGISILHQRRLLETPKNRLHDRPGDSTGVRFVKRRRAEDTVALMHPDQWCLGLRSRRDGASAKSSCISKARSRSLFVCFFKCFATPQLARQ